MTRRLAGKDLKDLKDLRDQNACFSHLVLEVLAVFEVLSVCFRTETRFRS